MDIARVKEGFFDQGHSIVEDAGDAEVLVRLDNGARNVWEKFAPVPWTWLETDRIPALFLVCWHRNSARRFLPSN